jgi:hypothetical protein
MWLRPLPLFCLEGCRVLLFIASDGYSAELRSSCRTQHESSRGRDDYPNRRAGTCCRIGPPEQFSRQGRAASCLPWLGSARDRSSIDGFVNVLVAVLMALNGCRGSQAVEKSRWPQDGPAEIEARLRSGHHGRSSSAKGQGHGQSAYKRGKKARRPPIQVNPSGSGNPAPVSRLSGEATNPIAILLQRCLARIWPKFVGLIRRNSHVSRNMASHRRSDRQ